MRSKKRKKKSAYRRGEKIVIILKKGIVVMSGVVAVMVLLLGLRMAVKLFPVRNIMVDGNYHLDERQIQGALQESFGRSLLKLSLDDLEDRLRQERWIKKAVLRKQFPDTIMIKVEEAVPKALLKREERMFIIDTEGYVLEEIEGDSTPFLPVMIGISPDKDRGGIMEALGLIEALDTEGFLARKDSVEVMLKPYGLVVNMDGEYMKVGYGRYREKLGRWKDLEAEIRKKDMSVEYIDLRYENEVIVKPVKKKPEKQGRRKK